MPFVSIDGTSQYVGESSAHVLISTGQGKESTAFEAAQCINRYIINGDERMVEANENFKRTYGHLGRAYRRPAPENAR